MEPEKDRHNVPVYSYSLAGLLLSPQHNQLRCAYAFDTGSKQWNGACNGWRCSDTEDVDTHANGGCAFNPSGLLRMLEIQTELRKRGWKPPFKVFDDHKFYNELILDDQYFVHHLPQSIEAVFYLPTACDDIYDGPKCEAYARGAHRNILRHFKLTEAQVPFVKFDYFDWKQPFQAVSNCDPVCAAALPIEPLCLCFPHAQRSHLPGHALTVRVHYALAIVFLCWPLSFRLCRKPQGSFPAGRQQMLLLRRPRARGSRRWYGL